MPAGGAGVRAARPQRPHRSAPGMCKASTSSEFSTRTPPIAIAPIGQFPTTRQAKFANDEYIQRRTQFQCHLRGDWHSSAREPEYEYVWPVCVDDQLLREKLAGFVSISKLSSHHPGFRCSNRAWRQRAMPLCHRARSKVTDRKFLRSCVYGRPRRGFCIHGKKSLSRGQIILSAFCQRLTVI
jgi:hypothetical protein